MNAITITAFLDYDENYDYTISKINVIVQMLCTSFLFDGLVSMVYGVVYEG